jgi:outer membrane lipoprotein SlyB
MENYRHHLSGFFEHRDIAQKAFDQLVAQGLPAERVHLFDATSSPEHKSTEGSNQVLKNMLVDGTIGTVAGTAVGGLVQVALIATNVTLFVASPLIAPLVLLGWGASIGGFVGATIGAVTNAKPLSALVEDAITNGQIVVVAETRSEEETKIAKEIFRDTIGDYQDVQTK